MTRISFRVERPLKMEQNGRCILNQQKFTALRDTNYAEEWGGLKPNSYWFLLKPVIIMLILY